MGIFKYSHFHVKATRKIDDRLKEAYFRGQKYFREYASLFSTFFCDFMILGEMNSKNKGSCVKILMKMG